MSKKKLGGAHVPHRKNTASLSAIYMPAPAEVLLPMSQHIGAPAAPTVAVGDTVYVGTKVAEAGGYVSSPVYSSVSGKVTKIETLLTSAGREVPAIRIASDGKMEKDPAIVPPTVTNFDEFSAAVRNSGVVGLGGAGFPTSVKLDAEKKGLLNTVVINGAECEPYITSDTRTMLDAIDLVKEGVSLLRKYLSVTSFVFGVEDNKPEAIAKLRETFAEEADVTVQALPALYPQGGEKVLIYNTTGRVVPAGKLPADVGCLVINVTTLAKIAEYVKTGLPLVEKCVTVDGSAVDSPKNVVCPIGTPIADLLTFAEVNLEKAAKVLYGGPMMGVAVYSLKDPVLKTTNAVTVFDEKSARAAEPTACIHCGRCVSACPVSLNPTLFAKAMEVSDAADRASRLEAASIGLCMECGCCSFVCPAKRPLVQTNRLAKADLREYNAHKATLA